MRIARVFPRKTKATPDDDLVFFGSPPLLFPPEVDEVHVSVAFTYDLPLAERLAREWGKVGPVKMGGPAFNQPGGEFVPGRYVKNGFTITSRGCPNKCWFCSVWKREKTLIELEIKKGHNLLDDNLLACSDQHVEKVFDMLEGERYIEFSGGLEAKRLKTWHVQRIEKLKIKQLFFAYDTPDDFEPLVEAARIMKGSRILESKHHYCRCYVLIGFPGDTIENANERLLSVLKLGIIPMAMTWKNKSGDIKREWAKFARSWIRPAIISHK